MSPSSLGVVIRIGASYAQEDGLPKAGPLNIRQMCQRNGFFSG